MASVNGSFASPSADATVAVAQGSVNSGFVASILEGLTFWKLLLTLSIAAVLYDQCKFFFFFFWGSKNIERNFFF